MTDTVTITSTPTNAGCNVTVVRSGVIETGTWNGDGSVTVGNGNGTYSTYS